MARISLYLDDRYMVDGLANLKIRISEKKEKVYINTGLKIIPEEWDKERECIPSVSEESIRINTDIVKLNALISKVREQAGRNSDDPKQYVTFIKQLIESAIRKEAERFTVMPVEKDCKTLLLPNMRAYRDRQTRSGTYEVYDRSIKAILAYDTNAETKTFDQIDYAWLKGFEAHWLNLGNKVNSLSIVMRCMRTVFNEALENEITNVYPFKKYKIRQEETRHRALTVEELRQFASMPVESWHEEYRDIFMLSFLLIGINMTDLLSLRPEDLRDGRIRYDRAKTGTHYDIKVEAEALSLINKHRGEKHLLSPLDRYSSVKEYIKHVNMALKQIGRETGKKGKVLSKGKFPELSTYWARHTWATLAYSCGVPVDVIGQALGHKDREHRVTMIYIRQDTRKVDEANRKVIDFFCGQI